MLFVKIRGVNPDLCFLTFSPLHPSFLCQSSSPLPYLLSRFRPGSSSIVITSCHSSPLYPALSRPPGSGSLIVADFYLQNVDNKEKRLQREFVASHSGVLAPTEGDLYLYLELLCTYNI